MRILLGSDHAGFELKNMLLERLSGLGHYVVDAGPFEYDPEDDYPEYVSRVAEQVGASLGEDIGIIIGGSGQGEAMAANRFDEVRAAVYYGGDLEIVKLSREHNDSNILSLGARFLTPDEAWEAVVVWLGTTFSYDERHERRNNELDELT